MVDLYKIYRALKQREKRANRGSISHKAAELVVEVMRIVMDSPTKGNCLKLIEAEEEYLGFNVSAKRYSSDVLAAVKSKDFEINRPVINRYSVNRNNPGTGYLYIAVSSERPGKIKLGYTTLTLDKRMQLFRSKYGYFSFYVHCAALVKEPAKLEEMIGNEFKPHRVSAMIHRDSTEWYTLKPKRAEKLMLDFFRVNDIEILDWCLGVTTHRV